MTTLASIEKLLPKWFMTISGFKNCMWKHRMGKVSEQYAVFSHLNEHTLANLRINNYENNTLDSVLYEELIIKLTVYGKNAYNYLVQAKASLGSITWSNFLDDNDCPVLRCGNVVPVVDSSNYDFLEQAEMVMTFSTNISWDTGEDVGEISFVNVNGEIYQTPNKQQENIVIDISLEEINNS